MQCVSESKGLSSDICSDRLIDPCFAIYRTEEDVLLDNLIFSPSINDGYLLTRPKYIP